MSDVPRTPPRSPMGRLRAAAARRLGGEGLRRRMMRGSLLTVAAFGGGRVMRIASNLILTRLLFPEAFGLMALVQVVLTGLALLSDTGLRTSVVRSERGDDRDFLDTVWTVKVIRGVILWLGACALAWPMAAFYDEPMLLQILPVVGLTAIVTGLMPTAIATADRHIRLGRITVINLSAQFLTIVVTVALAWALESVWALVWGNIASVLLKLFLCRRFLPDSHNRFHWDRDSARELFHFGKWILLATAFTFLVNNADKLILGAYISIGTLGIYSIGMMLATMPSTIVMNVKDKILMPLYRERSPWKNEENRRKSFFVRRVIMAAGIAITVLMSLVGVPLVELLYDDRYVLAGPVIVLLGLTLVARVIVVGSNGLLLAAGDSRRAMHLAAGGAAIQTAVMLLGASWYGLGGVIVGQGIAILALHPLRIAYMRRYAGWDAWGDLIAFAVGMAGVSLGIWLHAEEVATLFDPLL